MESEFKDKQELSNNKPLSESKVFQRPEQILQEPFNVINAIQEQAAEKLQLIESAVTQRKNLKCVKKEFQTNVKQYCKKQVEEEMKLNLSRFYQHKATQNKKQFEQEIEELQKYEEKLRHELEMKVQQRRQIDDDYNDTKKKFEVLKQRYENTEKNLQTMNANVTNLQNRREKFIQNFFKNEDRISKDVEDINDNINNINANIQEAFAKHEIEVAQKSMELTRLNEEKNSQLNLRAGLQKSKNEMQVKVETSQKTLRELQSRNEELVNSIKNIDQKRSELNQEFGNWNYEQQLNDLNKNAKEAEAELERLINERSAFQIKLESTSDENNELHKRLSNIENEFSILLSNEPDLKTKLEDVNTEATANSLCASEKLEEIESTISSYNERLTNVIKNKEEKQKVLNSALVELSQRQTELVKLESALIELNNNIELNQTKSTKLEEKERNLQNQLDNSKKMRQQTDQIYADIQTMSEQKRQELQNRIADRKNYLKNLKPDNELKIKTLYDQRDIYKAKLERERELRMAEVLKLKAELDGKRIESSERNKKLESLEDEIQEKTKKRKMLRDKLEKLELDLVAVGLTSQPASKKTKTRTSRNGAGTVRTRPVADIVIDSEEERAPFSNDDQDMLDFIKEILKD